MSNSMTVAEVRQNLESALHELAVWESVVNYLSKFLDSEAREVQQGITASACVTKTVPQEVVRYIVQSIEAEKMEPLNEAISGLENLQVVETTNGDQQSERVETKAQKDQKRVRIVAQSGRGKAS
jgi:hypothetical protein